MSASGHDWWWKTRVLVFVIVPLLAAVAAVLLLWNRYVFWTDLALLGGLYALTALGVTIGYHRMLTHQGFQAPAWLRGFFLVCGVMSCEGVPLSWAATHIKHHAHSDEEDDPHSPLQGFWHAHMGWMFHRENFADPAVYAPHLLQDPVVMFVERTFWIWILLALATPFALGGWTGLLWGGAVRIFLTTHATWSVNSICHTFGRREFETTDESRNEWIVGLLGFGEGWHNNHHAFPRNAFHGLRWWQLDVSGLIIRALEKLGFVWDVQRVSAETMAMHRIHAVQAHERLAALRSDLAAKIVLAERDLRAMMEKPFSSPLKPDNLADLSAACTSAMTRLEEIRTNIARATNLRRQRLLAYGKEVAELVERTKHRLPHPVAA